MVGAGIVGLATTLALSQRGTKVTLLRPGRAGQIPDTRESAQKAASVDAPFDRRVYAIAPASQQFLDELGIWSALPAERIAPVYDMRVYPSARAKARQLHLSAYEAGCEALAWIVESQVLMTALEQALGFARVKTVVGTVASIESDDDPLLTTVTCDDGQQLNAKLVVAADGATSPVRGLGGIAVTEKSYGQKALVAALALEHAHGDSAWQWFGDHGVLAVLPMPCHEQMQFADRHPDLPRDTGGHRASLVWSTQAEYAEQMLSRPPAELSVAITALAGQQLGQITALQSPVAFDLRLVRAESVIGQRLALVGDAAHVIHPLAGQGLNLGLADAQCLAAVLGDARQQYRKANFDAGASLLLRRYRRRRAEPVAAMQQVTDWLSRLFDPTQTLLPDAPELPRWPIDWIRDTGWSIAADSSFLRQQFVRYATQKS
ncbi:MAG: FAD-dependent monooxygenase [Burkholderiaceae bacterium]